jgi:hypothetical protein
VISPTISKGIGCHYGLASVGPPETRAGWRRVCGETAWMCRITLTLSGRGERSERRAAEACCWTELSTVQYPHEAHDRSFPCAGRTTPPGG